VTVCLGVTKILSITIFWGVFGTKYNMKQFQRCDNKIIKLQSFNMEQAHYKNLKYIPTYEYKWYFGGIV
jgi:hypothetical protein